DCLCTVDSCGGSINWCHSLCSFFSSRRRHTRCYRDWSSDVCSSDLGVPVGYEVAKALQAPLDVFVVRKLGVPGHEELAMGAIAKIGRASCGKECRSEW